MARRRLSLFRRTGDGTDDASAQTPDAATRGEGTGANGSTSTPPPSTAAQTPASAGSGESPEPRSQAPRASVGEPGDDDIESATTALFDREREAQEFSREAERGSAGRSGTEEWHAIEGELAATRRQLEEAHERAAAAERRATEIEIEARREIEREREARVREIEGTARSRKPAAPSLSSASFDELRELGMSVTQAKRVIRHREENDGFDSVDELDRIAGFPKAFLTEIKNRVSP